MPGTLTHSPAHVIQQMLIAESLGATPVQGATWPVTFSIEKDSPDNVLTVYDTGGTQQGITNPDRERQERHGMQIRIRASVYETGYAKARAIAVSLDGLLDYVVYIDGQGYLIHSTMRTSEVLSLGKDTSTSKRSLFTVNATIMLRQV